MLQTSRVWPFILLISLGAALSTFAESSDEIMDAFIADVQASEAFADPAKEQVQSIV
ncbi:MAG: hypothetical protein ACI9TH_001162, partial [Kiritimatiellia bacterium]